MLKHSFTYTIIEDYIDVDPKSKEVIKKIKLKDDEKIPGMNQTSFYDINESLNKLVIKKLGPLLKSFDLKLNYCWVQKYLKYGHHSIHTHHPKHKSFVWFIEGDKNSSPLSFYDVGYPYVDINTPKDFKFVPGTLLLFPGYMPHEVRPNKNNNRLVVSGNLV
tara:strand:- start:1646 stop:2131 length:486 start_codon:yes stop_codon:yes gene_type:complete